MRGYLIKNKIFKKLYKNKWFKTETWVILIDLKNLYLSGRLDNVFSVGHGKLYPEEIENTIKKFLNLKKYCCKKKHNILN